MNKLFYGIMMFLVYLPNIGMGSDIKDSLLLEVSNSRCAADSMRLLNKLALNLHYSDPANAIIYANRSLEIAKREDDKQHIAKSFASLALIYKNISNYDQARQAADSALIFFENDLIEKAGVFNTLGTINYYLSDYEKAVEYYEKAYHIYVEAGQTNRAATMLNNTALAYSEMNNYQFALNKYFEALKLHEDAQYDEGIALTMSNIGIVYFDLGNLNKALEYYYESLKIREKLNDDFGIASASSNIGNALGTQGKHMEALPYFDRAIAIFQKNNDLVNLATVYAQVGHYQLVIGEKKDGLKNLNEALRIHQELGAKQSEAYVLISLGDFHLSDKKLKLAYEAFEKARKIFSETGNQQMMAWALEGLSRYHEQMGNTSKALKLYKEFNQITDSLYAIESSQKITNAELIYESTKQENKIQLLTKEKELQQITAQKIKQSRNLFLLITILVIVAILLLFMRFRLKSRFAQTLKQKNIELSNKQIEIETQKQRIEKQFNQLKSLDEAKSRFFANISHEFRTPLTLIQGPVDDLIQAISITDQPEELLNNARMAKRNIQQLEKLTNQMLDLSKIKAGKMQLQTSLTDITTLLKRIKGNFDSGIPKDKKIHIKFEPKQSGFLLYIDKEKMEYVFNNLISNAIKAIKVQGEVLIRISKSPIKENTVYEESDFIQIEVKDNGVGIRNQDLPQLFNRFFRADDTILQGQLGSGIGLEYTRELIELHGGSIDVESDYGKGSSFFVRLPLGRQHLDDDEIITNSSDIDEDNVSLKPDIAENQKLNSASTLHKYTILLVEDHLEMREYISTHLQKHFTVIEVSNGAEALRTISTHKPDLILSDLMMPEIDGLTLLRMIRETPSTEDIPFILLTAKSDEDNRLAGYSEKADAYITKPFHANELIIRISNLLNNRKRLEGKLGRKIIAIDLESDTYEQADQAFLANVKETILKELANSNFTIKQLAESVFLSERQFRRKLNSLTGLSPLDFIRQIRLLHARALIENKVFDTIAEVAAAVGFNNPAYFSRLYKKLYGHPPNAPDEESSVSS